MRTWVEKVEQQHKVVDATIRNYSEVYGPTINNYTAHEIVYPYMRLLAEMLTEIHTAIETKEVPR